jgi:hypothetical protein
LAAAGPLGGACPPLKARILAVAGASPLLRWACQGSTQQQQQEQQQQQQGASWSGELEARGQGGEGPAAALAAGCARSQALLELLSDLAAEAQAGGERRRVALVAGSPESAAALRALLSGAGGLAGAEVALLEEAPEEVGEESVGPSAAASGAAELAPPAGQHEAAAEEDDGLLGGAFVPSCGPVADLMAAASMALDAAAARAVQAAAEETGGGDGAAAAPGALQRGGGGGSGLVVHVLHTGELAVLQQRIQRYHCLVWYSALDVLHASSQELESAALSACHRLSAAAAAAGGGGEQGGEAPVVVGPSGAPAPAAGRRRRLDCHVLAAASQVLALGEVRRVDHSLKAAMQLVLLGDVAAEEKLTMLAHRDTAGALEPLARAVLDTLCLGLCGTPPALATMAAPTKEEGGDGGAGDGGGRGEAAALLFQSSVTLPAAHFPPERFHVAGASMPLEVFVGPPLPSEAAAANAAALLALATLHKLGIVVRYWPSRLLLAQYLLPHSLQGQPAAAAAAALGLPLPPSTQQAAEGPEAAAPPPATHQQPLLPGERRQGDAVPAAAAKAAAATAAAGLGYAGAPERPPPPPNAANVMNFFCPLCNVAATGHKVGSCRRSPLFPHCFSPSAAALMRRQYAACALLCPRCPPPLCAAQAFDAHLRGFRHQRRIKQAQLLQQGQEVSAMLQGLLLEEAGPPRVAAHPAATHRAGLGLEEEEGGGAPRSPLPPSRPRPCLSALLCSRAVLRPLLPPVAWCPPLLSLWRGPPPPSRPFCSSPQRCLLPSHARPAPPLPPHARYPAGEYGSPSFANRQVYSPEPTPYRCDTCGVYCTSQRLLEAHMRGRKHQRRLAGPDSPGGHRSSSPK